MNKRIAFIRKQKGLNQQEFADAIGLTKNYVSLMETGARTPSDRTIADICRIFNVNPEWMDHGEEPIFSPDKDNDSELIDRFMEDSDNPMRELIAAIIKTYMQCDPKDKDALKKFATSFSKNIE